MAHASSLCAACDDICPVEIPLHDLLLDLRRDRAERRIPGRLERIAYRAWSYAWSTPLGYRLSGTLGLGAAAAGGALRRAADRRPARSAAGRAAATCCCPGGSADGARRVPRPARAAHARARRCPTSTTLPDVHTELRRRRGPVRAVPARARGRAAAPASGARPTPCRRRWRPPSATARAVALADDLGAFAEPVRAALDGGRPRRRSPTPTWPATASGWARSRRPSPAARSPSPTTGSIVTTAAAGRAAALIAPLHVCVVADGQLVGGLAEALRRLPASLAGGAAERPEPHGRHREDADPRHARPRRDARDRRRRLTRTAFLDRSRAFGVESAAHHDRRGDQMKQAQPRAGAADRGGGGGPGGIRRARRHDAPRRRQATRARVTARRSWSSSGRRPTPPSTTPRPATRSATCSRSATRCSTRRTPRRSATIRAAASAPRSAWRSSACGRPS